MADASGVSLNTVRGALVVAEAELSGKDGQINNISEALDDCWHQFRFDTSITEPDLSTSWEIIFQCFKDKP